MLFCKERKIGSFTISVKKGKLDVSLPLVFKMKQINDKFRRSSR